MSASGTAASAVVRTGAKVGDALRAGRPLVALESTVLAQGLPRPRNEEVGLALEARVREGGCVPATVAVLAGTPRAGLTREELLRLCRTDGVRKTSSRDLSIAMARGADAATTVAATMAVAASAGIEVFATGGIGGVHRDGVDVSGDLYELARTPMLVVCSGAKAILDLRATREALETLGVPVLGWRTDRLPAFYAAETPLRVDARVDTPEEVAEIWRMHRRLGAPGSVLLCVPPPPGAAFDPAELDALLEAALASADRDGVTGGGVTPFLLADLHERSGGRTVDTNIALLLENARVAGEVAVALARES